MGTLKQSCPSLYSMLQTLSSVTFKARTQMTSARFLTYPTVAAYLDREISRCGKTQLQISRECGFPKPNIITMIKQGHTKLPLTKVGSIAKSLGVDPAYLLRLALREYFPDTYSAIEDVLSPSLLTQNEMSIVNALRKLTLYSDPDAKVILKHGIVAIIPHGHT